MLAEPRSMSKEQLGADLLSSFTLLRVQELKGAEGPRLHLYAHPLLLRHLRALLQSPVLPSSELWSYLWVNIMCLPGFAVVLVSFAPGL